MKKKPYGESHIKTAFMRSVEITPTCWLWIGSREISGYGKLSFNCVPVKAHRFSYFLFNGPFDEALGVLHKCDNPKCVNPEHLFLGDQKDNVADMLNKHRGLLGSRNGQSKLDEKTVLRIHAEFATGDWTKTALAKKYGVSRAAVQAILNGRRWTHLQRGDLSQPQA